jgi:hypothetical protein
MSKISTKAFDVIIKVIVHPRPKPFPFKGEGMALPLLRGV